MAAIGQQRQFNLAGAPGDGAKLLLGSVLVLLSLYDEYRALNVGQQGLDVPPSEIRMQPDVVPSPEGPIRIGVVASQTLPHVGALVSEFGSGNALYRQVFNEHVRRQGDDSPYGMAARVNERD